METKDFRKLLKQYFKPRINDLSFKGSDHHFINQTREPFIYALVIQANKYGGSCIMEMGVNIDFFKNEHQESKITVYD
jgi:hypothetical protein